MSVEAMTLERLHAEYLQLNQELSQLRQSIGIAKLLYMRDFPREPQALRAIIEGCSLAKVQFCSLESIPLSYLPKLESIAKARGHGLDWEASLKRVDLGFPSLEVGCLLLRQDLNLLWELLAGFLKYQKALPSDRLMDEVAGILAGWGESKGT